MIFPDTHAATEVSGTWHSPTRQVLISDMLNVEQFHEITHFTQLIDIFAQCVKERTDAFWISLPMHKEALRWVNDTCTKVRKEAQRRDNNTCVYICFSDLKLSLRAVKFAESDTFVRKKHSLPQGKFFKSALFSATGAFITLI